MPNTLAHIAVNGILLRQLAFTNTLPWIYLSCIIPDIPWILQRLTKFILSNPDYYTLRAYFIVQASLFMCIVLSISFAFLAHHFTRAFVILTTGSALHLILDATQIKWANGVHLFAPFSWELQSFSWYWPESWITTVLSLSGLIVAGITLKYYISSKEKKNTFNIKILPIFLSVCFAILYFILPLFFVQSVKDSNSHFIATLHESDSRIGKTIELDRVIYSREENRSVLTNQISGDSVFAKNLILEPNVHKVSVKGYFIDKDTIHVDEYHIHHAHLRDTASYIGLFVILLLFIIVSVDEYQIRKISATKMDSE